MKKNYVVLVALILVCSGCAWFGGNKLEKPAQDLIQDGIDAYDKGQYSDAIKNFEQLKDWYPFSKYAILAELKIADAHYNLKQYPEAIQAYGDFEQLHPRNEAVPYVIYQIGRSYYDQIDTVDRDQTSAQKALETFRRLLEQYPNDPYSQKARNHILNCYKSLSGHEFYIAMFYYKKEKYEAARQRFLDLVTHYPDVGMHYSALQYLANCEALLQSQASATE
jgi:outer membrane protein assembly factor BamD